MNSPHTVGGRTLVKRREVGQPVAQRLALGRQLVALHTATRHVVPDHAQRDGGGNHEYQRDEVRHEYPNGDTGQSDHHGKRDEVALVSLAFLLRMIFAVLLDSAEPQRVGAPGQRAEKQIQRLTIDGIGHVVGSRQPCDVIVVHGLHAPERAGFLVTARVDADGADMRKMHERSREIVLALAIPAPPDGWRGQARRANTRR